ncbi:hypothetical protein BABINDRAFT_160720 [Babjeviella inositovora NRRL Y-12698]|uniref:DH domain-containing protein n=1 Tax=Babjeviella inositovora NRRL Y-12698 TaxID=984486 RepID=A0A1E3QUK8_9ASCO|nr:uncharacterized protein BABINDRAFT_160720 [Babjeviella inositovora NRRL Y-12698]ODQ81371.1 hypothetical protein BABINDRAFT_160720 [Babjeviella inositovora NRRL Y-12698]
MSQPITTRSISFALTPSSLQMNQKASASASLYYICLTLKSRLARLHDMAPYLALAASNAAAAHEQQQCALAPQFARIDALECASPGLRASSVSSLGLPDEALHTFMAGLLPAGAHDPVTQLWKLCQQGSPLCLLFNVIKPSQALPVVASDDLRICKKSVYDFLIACKVHLNFQDEELFTISDVFANQSEGFLKVVGVLNAVCDLSPQFALAAADVPRPPAAPSSARGKVLLELIDTERKYVQDLTVLHAYKTRLSQSAAVPPDLIHTLFPNLLALLDFQRRLLVSLEINYVASIESQTVGSVFVHARSYFRGYESWCVGSKASQELIEKERAKLDVGVLDVGVELPAYLIKPVQRLCKYPLLLRELEKATQPLAEEMAKDESKPDNGTRDLLRVMDDLAAGLTATRLTANLVNEQTRKQENLVLFRQLVARVANWRGYDLASFGELSAGLALEVKDNDCVRSFWCYLFDEIVLFFKDVGTPAQLKKKKKSSASFASLISGTSANTSAVALDSQPANTPLELKGRIYTLNIYKIQASPPAAQLWGGPTPNPAHFLLVGWTGGIDAGVFVLRFPNEEVRAQFETMLRRVVARQQSLREREAEGRDGRYSVGSGGFIDDESRRSSNSSGFGLRSASMSSNSSYSNGYASVGYASAPRQHSEHYSPAAPIVDQRLRSLSQPLYRPPSTGITPSMQHLSLSSSPSPTNSTSTISNINVQLTYCDEPMFLLVSPGTSWRDWCDAAYAKLQPALRADARTSGDAFAYKYKDEDGDWVVLGARDWEDVIEWCVENNDGDGLCVAVS